MTINPLLEWLLIPVTLTLAWHHAKRRRLLLIGATVYYAQRLTTYLYFAPTVRGWTTTGDAVPLSHVGLWPNLDLARMTLDLAVIVILAPRQPPVARRSDEPAVCSSARDSRRSMPHSKGRSSAEMERQSAELVAAHRDDGVAAGESRHDVGDGHGTGRDLRNDRVAHGA